MSTGPTEERLMPSSLFSAVRTVFKNSEKKSKYEEGLLKYEALIPSLSAAQREAILKAEGEGKLPEDIIAEQLAARGPAPVKQPIAPPVPRGPPLDGQALVAAARPTADQCRAALLLLATEDPEARRALQSFVDFTSARAVRQARAAQPPEQ